MAIIKAFTDFEQSRKLAKILPLESADMLFQLGEYKYADSIKVPLTKKHWEQMMPDINPCWSLASLIELLPKRIEIVDNVYELSIYFYGIYYWNITNGNLCFESKDKDNFVDACYEAIVFLHEQKLSLYRMNKK